VRARQRPRDTEISDEGGAVGGEQQVLGLDIPVHHAVTVRVLERPRGLGRDAQGLVHRKLLLPPEPVTERLALDERHREPELASGLARVVDGEDVRVLEPGGELDLALEALGPKRTREIGVQHLERDRPVVSQVLGGEHGGHPAPPELALEGICCGEGRLQLRAQVRQTARLGEGEDRKSTRLNSSHVAISYAVFCLKKKKFDSLSISASSTACPPLLMLSDARPAK